MTKELFQAVKDLQRDDCERGEITIAVNEDRVFVRQTVIDPKKQHRGLELVIEREEAEQAAFVCDPISFAIEKIRSAIHSEI